MIVSDMCPKCFRERDLLNNENITVLDINKDDKAIELVKKTNVSVAPAVIEEYDDGTYKIYTPYEYKNR